MLFPLLIAVAVVVIAVRLLRRWLRFELAAHRHEGQVLDEADREVNEPQRSIAPRRCEGR